METRPFAAFALLVPLLCACDPISGIRRGASVHSLPDLEALKARVESYPERIAVKGWREEGGRSLTWTGLQAPDEVHYLAYDDGDAIHGTLMFIRDYRGRIEYSQSLLAVGRPPPQASVDATWPIMKRIERDLACDFGMPEIAEDLCADFVGVEDPERGLYLEGSAAERWPGDG